MYTYDIYQWFLFFMIYCFIGWCCESLYVSWEHKKWVNRGFLNGPFLPIYGTGAIIMLFCALPVRDNTFLIFLFGMLSATILEYFTGWAIEVLFKTSYWDYSNQPFNLNGYICLGCSLTWGVYCLVLVKVIHTPIEKFVTSISSSNILIIDILLLCYFLTDFYASLRQAIDLRKVIVEYLKNNEEVQRMQRRIDVVIAFRNEDKENFQNMLEEKRLEHEKKREEAKAEFDKLMAEMEEKKQAFMQSIEKFQKRSSKVLKRNPGATPKKHRITADELKELLIRK